ncbi:mucin-binding protein, partial [Streptococcus suis]
MYKNKKGFDWYTSRQRFSIRKFHFGAASILLGLTLAMTAGQEISANTSVSEDFGNLVSEVVEADETENILSSQREVVISYIVDYIDESGQIISHQVYHHEQATAEVTATAVISMTAQVPEGYVLSEGQSVSFLQTISEGAENRISFKVKLSTGVEEKVDNIEAIPQGEPLGNSNSLENAGTTETEVLGESSDRNENAEIANIEILGEDSERKENTEIANTKVLEEGIEGVVPSELVQEVPKNGVFEEVQTSPRIANSNLVSTVNELPPLPMDLPAAKEVFEQVISEATVLASEGERLIASKEANNDNLKVAVAETNKVIASSKEDLIASLESIESIHRQITSIRERVNLLAVELRKISPDGEITVLLSSTSHIASGANDEETDGSDSTAYTGSMHFKNYAAADMTKIKKQITWLDFSDASWTGLDRVNGSPALVVGATYKKEIAPGYVVEITVSELKPFESTDVYRDRVKGTDKEWTYNPNAVNSNMKTYVNGKTDYGNSARIIAAPQDRYSNAKVQGFDVPGLVTLRSIENFGNVGVKFTTKATYLGNVVPLNVVFMSGEEARDSEFETYTTNGEAFELFGETSNSNTVSSYKVLDNWLEYNGQDHSGNSADWKARFDGRYWANIATEDSLKTAKQSAFYRKGQPTKVVDGIGTKVFGPVSNHLDSGFSTPIIMTKNASEVGMYIMSTGRQSAMIGVALLDYGDAPDSYGSGAHSINFNEADRQPYLGSKPADIDFIPEGIPNGSVPWYRDELINQFDEGPEQLMGSAVESGVNYTLHHSNNGTYALRFTANTNNNDRAYVQGWIDFNNDGRFDESENSGILEVVRGKTEYTLNFKDIYQNVDTSVTKLGVRMRIALDAVDIITPDLTAYSGEVEDFQIQMTHPPRGTKKETIASQGETQTGTVEFFAYGQNTYETTLAKIDEAVPPSIVKENGQLVQDSELVDGYYVVPGEGRYKITGNGKDVNVEFIPEPGFVTRLSDGSIIKQAKGITIRRTSTVLNQEGTAAYTTGWTAITDVHGLVNISEQTNTMDGRYIPHVVAVVPSGVDATSSAVQGAVQTGRPTFVPGTISTGAQVPMDPNTTKLLDEGSNPVDATTAYAMVNGVRTAVGEYRISSTDGTVTYTPNDEGKRYIGSLLPVTVQAKDVNGSAATATYTPTITPLSPSAVAATSVGLQGKQQTGRPTFTKGSAIDGVGELVLSSLTLLDASGQPATRVDVPNQGSYVLNPDGSITFTPLPDYYGSPTPVNVRQADSNGSTVVTTYSPNVIEVRPIADPDRTYGLKGAEQTSRSDFFTAGQIDLNGDKVYDPATEVVALNPASRKLINQQGQEVDSVQVAGEGVYRLNGDGTITFTPEPDFVGLANGVTITIADVNGTKVSTTYVPKVIDVPEDELRETVKRTIRYVYADGREASTSVEKVLQYTRTATANPLTGEISYSPWESTDKDFPLVTSPGIPNYKASQDDVKERTDVPAEAVDETITIVYSELDKQLATFTYRVVDGPELAKEQEIGYSSAPITYTTDAKIAEIIARGYELVEDGFANEANKSFDTDTARVQNWDILFRPKTTVTTPDQPKTPGDQADPNNPDSPRWEEVTKTITRTVSYKLNAIDGPEAPGTSSQTNTVTFERTGTYNFVSNQITYSNWVAKDGDATLEGHALPDVLGYTATKATANDEEVLPLSTTRNKTVTHLDNNITEIVVYTPDAQLGKISFINVTDPSQEVLVKEIPLTGKTGDKFTVDTVAIIEEFRQQGYEVSDISNYDKEGLFSPDPNSHDEFIYHLTERVVPVDPSNPPTPGTPVDPNNPDGPKWPDSVNGIVTKDEVKRTISYVDEAGAPVSSIFEDTVSFTRTATVNLVTGAVNLGSWEAVNSDKELAGNPLPTIAGYSIKGATSDSLVAEATVTENPRTVEAEAPDIVEVVTYQKDKQEAIIRFVDVTNPQARNELNTITLSGKSSEEIGYDVTPLVNLYEKAGYQVSNKQAYSPATLYDTEKDVTQEFIFELVQKTTTTTPDNPQTPGTPVDPNNPDGPVWEEVTKTITRTVSYKLNTVDGPEAPGTSSQTNSVTFERTGSYNHVTKRVTYTDWVAKDGDSTLEGQTLPLVTGYVAVTATRNSQTVTPSATAEAIEASATTDNVDEIVVYKALSSWTITPPPGTDPVPPIPYDNHPTDPTRPADPTPTPAIPKVDGYVPVGPEGNELPKDPDGNYIPPVPTDPTQPTVITYKAVEQKAVIQYLEEGSNKVLSPADEVTGLADQPIVYSTADTIALIEERGYELVQDNFPTNATFDRDTTSPQIYRVVFREKVVTTTPDNPQTPGTPVDPNNPDGPKWPDGLKESDLNQTVTRTIKYQYEDGSEAQPDVVETLTYKRTATVNLVTKEVTYGKWTSTDDDFDKIDTPAIVGYTPDKASVAAVQDVPATATDTEVTVTYVKDIQKATITYQDENGQQLGGVDEVTGKSGESINYTTTARITELTNQGYEVVTDGFTKEGGQVFDTDKATDQTFTVIVKAKVVSITPDTPQTPGTPVDPNNPDGPKWPDGLKESDLNQTVTRTIKYQYEDGSEAQPDVVETLPYKRTATVNLVTKEVTYGNWTSTDDDFDKVDTPAIAGYTPDKISVEAILDVPSTALDTEIVVTYVKDGQKATITYQDENGQQLGGIDEVTGKSGEPINYTTTARITELTNQGYEVVTDGFTKEGGQVFDTDKDTPQTFTVIVKAKVVSITPDNPQTPGTPVDPTNPDGPKWPDGLKESDLNQTVTRTIKYKYEDGSEAQPDVVENLTYKRTATVNLVTKEVTYGNWTSTDDDFDKVDTPAIVGYTPDKASVAAVQDVPATATDTEVTVTYVKDIQKATITYQDENGQQLGGVDEVTGKSGEPINYTTTARITELTNQGYEVVTDGFTKEGGQVFDTDKDTPQTFTVIVKAKVVSITPDTPQTPGTPVDPNNPDGPKWPDGLKENDLNKTVIRTILYKYENETSVLAEDGKPIVVKQVVNFQRTAKVNIVTGSVTYGEWSESKTVPAVDSPVIKGYITDTSVVPALTITANDNDQTITVVYREIGSWVPNIPGQPVTPIPYPNHPTDPTKPGDEVPTLPHVPGFIPVGPDGVTPLPPVDPDDPSKGYELPPIPTDPGVDTPINYVPEAPKSTTVSVKYVDESGKDLLPPIVTEGKVGDNYTSEGKVIKGYLLKEVPSNATGRIVEGGTVVTYVYVPIGSWVPNIPGQPVTPIPYPNHPTDPTKPGDEVPTLPHVPGFIPVGPDGVTPLPPVDPDDPSKGYELPPIPTDPGVDTPISYVPEAPKSTMVTVKYMDESGKDLLPPVVTEGKVGDSYTSEGKVIKGYLLKEVPSNATGTMVEGGTVVTYVYVPIGSWVPNIPGQPVTPIPYPNHPTDPTKPGDEVPTLPHVPGFIPVGPDGVTPLPPVDPDDPSKGYELPPIPTDPGVDTPINYVPEAPKSTTVTVKYVDESGKDLLPPVVTEGKVGDSYTSEGKVIEGYLLKEVPSNATGTMVEGGTVVTYVYVPIGSWIPNIPGQPVTPIPYPNHPTDPTKPGDEVPTLPHVPGFIPVGPDGVTPLPPVDPDDPSKGYELPPIPTDPGVDTPINYVP